MSQKTPLRWPPSAGRRRRTVLRVPGLVLGFFLLLLGAFQFHQLASLSSTAVVGHLSLTSHSANGFDAINFVGKSSGNNSDSTITADLEQPGWEKPEQRLNQQQRRHGHRPFPRWGYDRDGEGISLDPLLRLILGVLHNNASIFPIERRGVSSKKKKITANEGYPEMVYVVDGHGIWTSSTIRKRTQKGKSAKGRILERVVPTERIMSLAWEILTTQSSSSPSERHEDTKWPSLRRALTGRKDGGGFPFLFFYGDVRASCNDGIWKDGTGAATTIPVFATSGLVDENCAHAWPFPTYQTVSDSKNSSSEWDRTFRERRKRYPWRSKIRKVVWRGSLTGPLLNYTSPRARIGAFAANRRRRNRHNDGGGGGEDDDLFDVGITRVPQRKRISETVDVERLGGIVPSMPMEEFQRYRAVLDVDGNSWSARFGALLCYESVVLKVEPRYVDYFHLRDLVEWRHYVPVRYDLSDLEEKARWAADPANDGAVRRIVDAANAWCRARMVYDSIAADVLDIWNSYVEYLDRRDPLWIERWTAGMKAALFQDEFDMIKVSS